MILVRKEERGEGAGAVISSKLQSEKVKVKHITSFALRPLYYILIL
jgi:hypothetical protein